MWMIQNYNLTVKLVWISRSKKELKLGDEIIWRWYDFLIKVAFPDPDFLAFFTLDQRPVSIKWIESSAMLAPLFYLIHVYHRLLVYHTVNTSTYLENILLPGLIDNIYNEALYSPEIFTVYDSFSASVRIACKSSTSISSDNSTVISGCVVGSKTFSL